MTRSFPKSTRRNFTCRRNRQNKIGYTTVFVDDNVSPVIDFKCITRDLKDLSCSFMSQPHTAPIEYKLKYFLNEQDNEVNFYLKK